MSAPESNRTLARQINDDARKNPHSPYAGKFVGIVNGRVAVIADSLAEMAEQLKLAEADPENTFWIEASADYDEVHEIWSLSSW